MPYSKNISYILTHCGCLRGSESLLILCDKTTKDLGEAFKVCAKKITQQVNLIEIPLAKRHGEEPPQNVKVLMMQNDLIMSLCKYSLAHSRARFEASNKGARFLSMPGYSWELLKDPAVTCDYKSQAPKVRIISDAFTQGSLVEITTKSGTNVKLDIRARNGNYCPGFVVNPGDLGSPPDIEANISPVEDKSAGVIIVDGSITCSEIGKLEKQVILTVRDGKCLDLMSENEHYELFLNKIFRDSNSKRRILAECGVGLNPLAKLSGNMLTDEGTLGTVHFGFGSNHTVGGLNETDFHLDFVVKNATLKIDGKLFLRNGELIL